MKWTPERMWKGEQEIHQLEEGKKNSQEEPASPKTEAEKEQGRPGVTRLGGRMAKPWGIHKTTSDLDLLNSQVLLSVSRGLLRINERGRMERQTPLQTFLPPSHNFTVEFPVAQLLRGILAYLYT